METNEDNQLSGDTWDSELVDTQMPDATAAEAASSEVGSTAVGTNRSSQDEIISVYEVFVKDDVDNPDGSAGKPEISVISALPVGTSQHQIIQGEYALDLDAIDIISVDGDADDDDDDEDTRGSASQELLEKDSDELEATQSTANTSEENMVARSQTGERPSSTNPQLIDKDDPRSRLHYVKYLKRDGKTLKIWECGICTKEFRHQYTLMRHLPTHTDERNFKCDACGKAFRQLSTLSQHKAIHSDARPYVCEFCKKTFNRVSTLISHRKTHSEHKPHKCHLCGKGFHQKGNLRNHVFTHTNERPYKCEICNKGFNQMSNLVCHKVKAHAHIEKMQYSCGICGDEFPRRVALRSHEESKHGIKYRQTTATSQSGPNEPRRTRSKSVRVVPPPEEEQPSSFVDSRDKDLNMTEFMENIIIDKIETQAMEAALMQGQTPFALFKPAKGIPVLVKITPSGSANHLLTPATADDLKLSGKMDENSSQFSDADGSKSIQIKVPVVATVTEKIEPDGKSSFIIEAPGPEQEKDNILTPIDSVSEVFSFDELDEKDEDLLVEAEQHHQLQQLPYQTSTAIDNHDATDEELLELAKMGGIQFVRETEDGQFEVMTNREARDLMAQNSHDVKIFDADAAEEMNGVMKIPGDLDYLPVSTVTNLPQHQQQHPFAMMAQNTSNDMMVDPNDNKKVLTLGDIEILEDKELKHLLDSKCLEDQYGPDLSISTGAHQAYYPAAKIEDILNIKPTGMDMGVPYVDRSVFNWVNSVPDLNTATASHGLAPGIATQRSEHSMITASSLYGRSMPQQQQLAPLNATMRNAEALSFLKNNQSFTDELNGIFGEEPPPAIDYSMLPEYGTRLRMPEFEENAEAIFRNLSQSNAKVIAQKNHCTAMLVEGTRENLPEESAGIDKGIENRINLPYEAAAAATNSNMQYEEFKFLDSYDQFFKSQPFDASYSGFNSLSTCIPDIENMKKDMQLLERTLESKFFSPEDFDNKESERPMMYPM